MEEFRRIFGVIDKKAEIINSLITVINDIKQTDDLNSVKQNLLDHAIALEDGIKHEKAALYSIIDEIEKVQDQYKSITSRNEEEKIFKSQSKEITAGFLPTERIKSYDENTGNQDASENRGDVPKGPDYKKENYFLREKLSECLDELSLQKEKYERILYEKNIENKINPDEIIISNSKLEKVVEIYFKTIGNENLIRYLESETDLNFSLQSLANVEEKKLELLLKVLANVKQKEKSMEKIKPTQAKSQPLINKKTKDEKVILSDNLSKFNLEYKKPKTNKNLDFPIDTDPNEHMPKLSPVNTKGSVERKDKYPYKSPVIINSTRNNKSTQHDKKFGSHHIPNQAQQSNKS